MVARELSHVHVWEPRGSARTLLLLHGTGGDERDLLPLASALDPAANVLSVRGQVLENGMPRFFRRHGPGVLDLDDLHVRTLALAEFIAAASRVYGFDIMGLVAVGFSNGANIAASLLFEAPESLGGAILIRAMLPYRPKEPLRLAGKRALILAGERDPYSARPVTEELGAILRGGGAAVATHYAPAGHELTAEDVASARAWLA